MLPKGFAIRKMARKELDTAVEWAAKEGWNPGLHDANVFWTTDPNGYYALVKDEKMIGSVSGVCYEGKFGFGGFFILAENYRKQRLGTELANHMFDKLKSRLTSN